MTAAVRLLTGPAAQPIGRSSGAKLPSSRGPVVNASGCWSLGRRVGSALGAAEALAIKTHAAASPCAGARLSWERA